MKRVLLAGLFHETHTFVPGKTGLSGFTILRGSEILEQAGNTTLIAAALEVGTECGWEFVPAVTMEGDAGPLVEDSVVETFWTELAAAARYPVDAVFLNLHGAMGSESFPDVEAEIVRRLRLLPGCETIPVGGPLDLHGNISREFAGLGNAFVAYRANPHTDAFATALTAARLLDRLMTTGEQAVTVFAAPGIVWPPSGTGTDDEPMRTLEAMARALEASHEEILTINVFGGFSFADVADAGVSFTAMTVGDPENALGLLSRLVTAAQEQREQGLAKLVSLEFALEQVTRCQQDTVSKGPILLVEPADNIGGGAPGDGTILLRALLERGIQNAGVVCCDPEVVGQLWEQPVGSTSRVSLSGKSGVEGAESVILDVRIVSKSDGWYELEDKQSHNAMYGLRQCMGDCMVVRAGTSLVEEGSSKGILILLTSIKTAPMDLAVWRSQGVDPESLFVIGIKAAVAHRRAFNPIARASYTLDTPGPCAENLLRQPYQHIRRPIFPLDG